MSDTVVQQQQTGNGTNGNVTALAVLQFIWGGAIVLFGLAFAIVGSTVMGILGNEFADFGGEVWGTLGAVMFAVIGIMFALVGSLGLISGAGLIRYRPWGRIFTLVLATISGIFGLLAIFDVDIFTFLVSGGFAAYAWVILTRPHIVALFHGGQNQQQTVVVQNV